MHFAPVSDNPLNSGRALEPVSVASATSAAPFQNSQRFHFDNLSSTDGSSVSLRQRASQASTILPLTQDSEFENPQSPDVQLMTLLSLATRFMPILEETTGKPSIEPCPARNIPPSVLTPAKRQAVVPCREPEPQQQVLRKKRRINSPTELKRAMIDWKNSLTRAKYLLDQEMTQDFHRETLLDDLREMHEHKDTVADLSPEDTEVQALVFALRPHRHKSQFGPEVRSLAIDILDQWSQRWFKKPLRRKGQTEP